MNTIEKRRPQISRKMGWGVHSRLQSPNTAQLQYPFLVILSTIGTLGMLVLVSEHTVFLNP